MLTCKQVGELLQSHLDGQIDELRARAVARHLHDCVRCGMSAQTYTEIKAALRRTSTPVPEAPLRRLRSFADRLAAGEVDGSGEYGAEESGS